MVNRAAYGNEMLHISTCQTGLSNTRKTGSTTTSRRV